MSNLDQFQSSATNWRDAIRRNQTRTTMVVIIFLLIYLMLGLLIDVCIAAANVMDVTHQIPLKEILLGLVTLKIIPVATIIMFGVACVSLLITYFFHENIVMLGTDYHEVTADTHEPIEERQLYNVIEELKIAAGLRFMPKVFIIEADYMNAFASGLSEKSAMVAITRGLLERLNRAELQAVMAHELSHIRHNDIQLILTVAILSNLMLIAIDLLFRGLLYGRSRDNRLILVVVLVRFLLPVITLLLMLYLSRKRELMADSGSVELLRNNQPLASALLKIDKDYNDHQAHYEQEYARTPHEEIRQASYLYDPKYAGISSFQSLNNLFSSHPPLAERLEALGFKKKNSES